MDMHPHLLCSAHQSHPQRRGVARLAALLAAPLIFLALTGCQLSLDERTPKQIALDSVWFDYEPPLTEEELKDVGRDLMEGPIAAGPGVATPSTATPSSATPQPATPSTAGGETDPDLFFPEQGAPPSQPRDPLAAGGREPELPPGVLRCRRGALELVPTPDPLPAGPALPSGAGPNETEPANDSGLGRPPSGNLPLPPGL